MAFPPHFRFLTNDSTVCEAGDRPAATYAVARLIFAARAGASTTTNKAMTGIRSMRPCERRQSFPCQLVGCGGAPHNFTEPLCALVSLRT